MALRIAQKIPDTEAEGPGVRFAVWVQGCTLRCPGCCNPEMFVHGKGGFEVEPSALAAEVLATPAVEGLSILGGEPFEQAAEVAVSTVRASVREAGRLREIVFCCFSPGDLRVYERLLGETAA